MGATQSCGIGVINKSTIRELNIGLSIAATVSYENGVGENEIFYRWPGAVVCTVYAFARDPKGSNDITPAKVAKEIIIAGLTGGVLTIGSVIAAALTVVTAGAILTPAAFALAPLTGGTALLLGEAAVAGAGAGLSTLGTTFFAYKTVDQAMEALGLAFKQSKLYCHSRFNFAGGNGSWLVVEGGPYMDKEGKFQPCDLTIRVANPLIDFAEGIFTKESHECFHTKKGLHCTKKCPYEHK